MVRDFISKETVWNSAQETSKRLANWIQVGNQYHFEKNYAQYYDCLMIVYIEISPKLNQKEREEVNSLLNELRDEYNNYLEELNKFPDEEITFRSTFPLKLFKFDVKLRKCADVHGLLIPDKKSIFETEEDM